MYRRFNYTLFPDSNCNISVLQVCFGLGCIPIYRSVSVAFCAMLGMVLRISLFTIHYKYGYQKEKNAFDKSNPFLLRLNVLLIKTIQFLDRKNQIERQRIIKGQDNIWFQYLS